jgi:two-component system response regulator HydG
MDQGQFREDLYYRLNVIHIPVPPLRERQEEIPVLAHHFLDVFRSRHEKPALIMTDGFYNALLRYSWPGNVRELENAIERAVIMSRGTEMHDLSLPEAVNSAGSEPGPLAFPMGSTLAEIQGRAIECVLKHTGGDKERAARLPGITPRTIYRFLERKRKSLVTDCQGKSPESESS